ncbi:MAG TPA: hypothetical protein VFA49_08625 [Chloroflexota bacterium]|jgi:hypothetical protein|nr:hypothetical protein [Chloroflexota bacterium]
MSAAAHGDPHADVEELLAREIRALQPEAARLRTALLRGESPESLGLVEDGLSGLLEGNGIEE